MIQYIKSHDQRNAILADLRSLDAQDPSPALDSMILAVKSYPEQQVYIMVDSYGNPIAVVACAPTHDRHLRVSYLGSIAPIRLHAASALLRHIEDRGLYLCFTGQSEVRVRSKNTPTKKEQRNVWNATYPA